jgi:hypothetical protein
MLLAVGPHIAFAQDAPGDDSHDVGDPLTMNSLTPVSSFGLEVGVPIWDPDDQNTSLTTVGVNVFGHYVDPGSGAGGYVNIPMSIVHVHQDIPIIDDYDDSEFSIGNIELGGMYAKWLRRFAIVGHVGVALPTNSADNPSSGNLFPAGLFSPLASAPRYTDLVDRIHDSTWLRMGASIMGRQGKLFWRGDLGVDIALDDDNDDSASPAYYFNAGGGIDLGSVDLQVEIDTLVTDTDGDDTNSVLAFGARFESGKLRPGLTMFIPLGWDDPVGDWDFGFGASILSNF